MMNEDYYGRSWIDRLLEDVMEASRKASTFDEIKQYAEGLEWNYERLYAELGELDWSDSKLEAAVNDNVPRLMAKLPYIGDEIFDIMEDASRECEKCSKVVGALCKKAAEYWAYAMGYRRLDNEALWDEYRREGDALWWGSAQWIRKAVVAKSIERACQSKISTWFVIVK